ncbi:hypothetical protein PACTADRAFT_2601 [Pachysolen tannophilus NRRL Y-2460]|uniref:U6 small nuclear RNA (adenine-(43)-N(6))-methyltransferase n=1 Tax=Pachysolen tannophilus NRRL Y-2460 TaxID=669874 RepID=A0A1E4TXC0_PACTA|nr:hypothetical protein PACTADRAFT_2601 [Pachysolen tannophilus NRRL Y-2460]
MSSYYDIDFTELSLRYPELSRHFIADTNKYDLNSNDAIIDLTKAILDYKFNLKINLNKNKLCPRIPNRLEYLKFIKELPLQSKQNDELYIIDVGTGHSVIYPLLGCRFFQNCKFIGTDIDQSSIQEAIENVKLNNLDNRIKIYLNLANDDFFNLSKYGLMTNVNDVNNNIITICNPPFYSSLQEIEAKKTAKFQIKKYYSPITQNEFVTIGGEYHFIVKMINESLQLKNKITWYTSLVGNFSNLELLVKYLKQNNIPNYFVKALLPSNKFKNNKVTQRWIIGWCFHGLKIRNSIIYKNSPNLKKFNQINEFNIPLNSYWDLNQLIETSLNKLNYKGELYRIDDSKLEIQFPGNVWSRTFRRKFETHVNNRHPNDNDHNDNNDDDKDVHRGAVKRTKLQLANDQDFTIFLIEMRKNSITIFWKYGFNYKIFESFCGFIKRLVDG